MTPAHKQTNPDKAPGQIVNPVHTLGDYLKLKETLSGIPSATTKEFDFGWNAALNMIDQFIETIYPVDVFNDFDAGRADALDEITNRVDKEKK